MEYLIYHSMALVEEASPASGNILAASLRNNRAFAITGFLHREDDAFLQYIEGPEAAVAGLWRLVLADARHEDVTLVVREPLARRQFSGWSMGYTSRDEISFREFLADESGKARIDEATADEALLFLRDGCQMVARSVRP